LSIASALGNILMRLVSACVVAIFAGLSAGLSHAAICQFAEVTAAYQSFINDESLPGGGILIGDRQGLLYETYLGSYSAKTAATAPKRAFPSPRPESWPAPSGSSS